MTTTQWQERDVPISKFLSKWEGDQLRLVLEARREYGSWLPDAFHWAHLVTGTIADKPLLEALREPFTFVNCQTPESVRKVFLRWIRHLERRLQHGIGWFCVIERGAAGRLHVHALTAGTESLTTIELERTWCWGRAVASVFDPSRPGSFYITKDFGLRAVEYDIAPPHKLQRKAA